MVLDTGGASTIRFSMPNYEEPFFLLLNKKQSSQMLSVVSTQAALQEFWNWQFLATFVMSTAQCLPVCCADCSQFCWP